MSHWNNRIYRHVSETGAVSFALHETFYGDDGLPNGHTDQPLCGHYDSVEELIAGLETMLRDARRFAGDVLEYPKQ